MDDHARPTRTLPAWAPLAATCLGQFMVVLDATIVNVALPAMRRGLHLSATDLQWVVNAYLLTLGGLILLGGRLGDHYGRKRVYLIGGALFSLASLAGGVAPTGAVLLAARAVQGVGAALLAPGTLSLLTSAYTEARPRARALAVWGATSAAGAALGVLLGGVLTDIASWRAVLFVNVPLGVLVVVLGRSALRETMRAEEVGRRLDVPGALTITAALTALVYGVVETERYSWGSTRTLAVLGAAVALFAAATVIEARTEHPLIPIEVVRRGVIATVVAMMLILGGVITISVYFESLYLQLVRGYSPLDAGLLMMPVGVLIMATPPVTTRLTARYGARAVAIAGLLVDVGALVWLAQWSAHGSVFAQMLAPALLFGLGGSMSFFAMTVLMTSEIAHEHSGLGSGLFNAGRQIGGSLGLAAFTVVAAAHTRSLVAGHHAPSGSATAAGYGFAFIGAAGLDLVGVAILAAPWVRRRSRRRVAGPGGHPVGFVPRL